MEVVKFVELLRVRDKRNILFLQLSADQMFDPGDWVEIDGRVWELDGVAVMGPFDDSSGYVGWHVTALT